ncbi:MAG: hypothetical protein ACK56K_08075 [Akkermansiaceae bacterium]|jgi:hypothetical protein|nr:hypothetical protein [Luteolibacter sp.]
MSGLTRRNLFSMRAFAEAFPDGLIAQQPVAQLPWGQGHPPISPAPTGRIMPAQGNALGKSTTPQSSPTP